MAYHSVLIPSAIAAMNIDSLNRSVMRASAIDNGNVFAMGAQYTSGSYSEVFAIAQPVSASAADMWMAYSGDEIVVTDARYKGIDPNPRNYYNEAGKVFSAYKPQKGDIIVLTAEAFTGSYVSQTYAGPIAGSYLLEWAAAAASSGLCYKYIGTTNSASLAFISSSVSRDMKYLFGKVLNSMLLDGVSKKLTRPHVTVIQIHGLVLTNILFTI